MNEQVEQLPLTVVSETTDDRIDGTDDYVAEPSFSVGKSPPPNGISAYEKPSDTGGLGAGTPKVSLFETAGDFYKPLFSPVFWIIFLFFSFNFVFFFLNWFNFLLFMPGALKIAE